MQVLPYLCFEGRCEEAVHFYQQVLGAEVQFLMRSGEIPVAPGDAVYQGAPVTDPQKLCHAQLKVGQNVLMLSDGMNSGQAEFKGISLTVSVDSDDVCRSTFQALSQDGAVQVEPMPTFFSSLWGCCTDKFGVCRLVMTSAPVSAQA